jgi:hypothetical protein
MLQTALNYSLEQHLVKHSTTYLELKLIQMTPIACSIFMVICATEREIFRDSQSCARLQTCARDSRSLRRSIGPGTVGVSNAVPAPIYRSYGRGLSSVSSVGKRCRLVWCCCITEHDKRKARIKICNATENT